VLAYPFGLDWPAWALMGLASRWVIDLAHWVASFDHSSLIIPAFGAPALACFAASLLWMTLWTTPIRFLAILPFLGGLAVAAKPERPDILIERDGSGILVRGAEGKLILAGKPSRFVLQQWLNAEGDGRSPDDAKLREGAACDTLGCIIRDKSGRSIAYARDRLAIAEDCRRADLVITPIPWSAACSAKLIDRMALSRDGATALISQVSGWRAHLSEQSEINRPWSRKPWRPQVTQPVAAAPPAQSDGAGDEPERLQ
jgi:competence protein ComEC